MTDRVLLGRREDGTYGLDISLPGYDVKTAPLEQMAFSTNWSGGAIIHQTGLVTEVWGKTVTFPTLPFVPLVYLVLRTEESSVTWSSVQFMHHNYVDTRFMFHPFCRVTDSSLFFDDQQNSRLPSIDNYDVRYVVFRTPGR